MKREIFERWSLRSVASLSLIAHLVLVARGHGLLGFWDERDYDAIARSLVAGQGFANEFGPTAFRPPAQPLFLAAIYALAGARPIIAQVVEALLLATLPFAAARLAKLVSRRPGVSLLAGTFAAIHPGLAYATTTIYPVVLTTVALTWGLALTSEALTSEALISERRRLAIGVALLAVAIAATPYFLPIPLVVAVIALTRKRHDLAAIALVVGLAPTALWSMRNGRVLGTFSPNTSSGYNLILGANDEATPRSGNWIEPTRPPGNEVERDRAHRDAARAWIVAHPARFVGLSLGRAVMVLDSVGRPRTRGAHDGHAARMVGWAMLPFTLLAVVELARRRRSVAAVLVAASLGCVVIAAAPTIVKPRFRFPCDPALAVFAAAGIAERIRARKSAAKEPACAP